MQSLRPSAPRNTSKITVVDAPENKNLIDTHIHLASNRTWGGFVQTEVLCLRLRLPQCELLHCHQPNNTKLGHFKFSMTWLSRDIKNQSYQPEQTMGTGSCLLKTMQLKLKETSEWFIEDFLANLFWDKTISEIFEVAKQGLISVIGHLQASESGACYANAYAMHIHACYAMHVLRFRA